MTNEWKKPEHVEAYLARMKDIPHRAEGEATLLAELPRTMTRILDLGCGNGHLLALVLAHCPVAAGVGLDFSPTMLEQARHRFSGDERITLVDHNMDHPLPDLGEFDGIISSFAIHHCAHERKRQLYGEVFALLKSGGVFCNLEHVSSPTQRIHDRFVESMGMTTEDEDPSNKLLDVETQLRWLREIGFEDVDCHWKWRELALLSGRKPTMAVRRSDSTQKGLSVRPYQSEDQREVIQLWGTVFSNPTPWNVPSEDIRRKLSVQRELFLVGVIDGRVVGTTMAGFDGHRGWLHLVAVHPDHQRRGIGRSMMLEAERRLREIGCSKVNLQVRGTNTGVLAFYESVGYAVEDRISLGKRLEPIQKHEEPEVDLLDRLLGHDSWTTRQLLDLAGTLTERQLDQEFDIGHRSVRRTFAHIIWNIECWTDLMKGNGVRPRPATKQSLALLRDRHDAASRESFQFAREVVDQHRLNQTFVDTLDDPPREKTFGGVIVHLATHGMHHRAQLLFMMRRLGVEGLPEGDALSWEQSFASG